tara:strand:+ start:1269 stop:1553 length:285 start_codon:yes stop_codon:yes gene_type:complete
MAFGITEAIGVGLSLVKANMNKKQSRSDPQMKIIPAEKTGRIPTSDPQYTTVQNVAGKSETFSRIYKKAEAVMKPVSIAKGIGEGTTKGLKNIG